MPILNQKILAALDLKVLTIQRTVAGRWWNFRNVLSPYSRLWLVLDGHGVVRHHGREFKLEAGQLHLVPPFTPHDCSCSRRLDHYHLHFISRLPTGIDLFSLLDFEYQIPAPVDALKSFRRLEAIYPDRKLPCFDPARDEYRRLPALLPETLQNIAPTDWFEANALLALLLPPFLNTAQEHQGMHARATRLFQSVQGFIHAHMHETILLGDLARVAKLHPTYFSDHFLELVGVRPLEYLMCRRIERAQYLLLASKASVKEIAAAVGISDPTYFSRVFTRRCRMSPKKYRATHSA
jgi:AraC-like DNA-binding protein